MTQPTAPDSNSYRQVVYTGGRILQAAELNFVQALAKDPLGDVFDDGATLNAKVVISDTTATLQLVDVTNTVMKVFVNGNFEVIGAGALSPVTLPASPVEGTLAYMYANFVLWKVTVDGANSTIMDPSLTDSAISEPGADRGQIQVTVGPSDSGSLLANMLSRGTVTVATLQWHNGAWITTMAGPKSQMLASPTRPGMVTVTGATTVASTDDDRLSDARVPVNSSVTTAKLAAVADATPSTGSVSLVDDTGVNVPLTINTVTGGVDAGSVVYATWSATVAASLTLIWSQITRIFGLIKTLKDSIAVLQGVRPLDLSTHIGHNIGSALTHPAVSDVGFQANGAIEVLASTTSQGEIDAVGNYHFYNHVAELTCATHGGLLLDNFETVAGAVKTLIDAPVGVPSTLDGDVSGGATTTLIQKIKGKSITALPSASTPHTGTQMVVLNGDAYELANIPAAGAGSATLAGDVTGSSAACTVGKIQGHPVSSAAPSTGQSLTFDGSSWAPAAGAGSPVVSTVQSGSGDVMTWMILRFGSSRIAFGMGQMKNGAVVQPPTNDWNVVGTFVAGTTVMNAAITVVNTFNVNFLHAMMNGYSVVIDASGPNAAAAISGAYATVTCFTASSN